MGAERNCLKMFIYSKSSSWKGLLFTAISIILFVWLGAINYWILISVIAAIIVLLGVACVVADALLGNRKN